MMMVGREAPRPACEAVALHDDGPPPRAAAGGGARGRVSGGIAGSSAADYDPPPVSSGSSSLSSLFSSTPSETDDEEEEVGATATSAPSDRRHVSSSSMSSFTSSESETTSRTDDGAAAAGPLYELSTMLENLPVLSRTGLSKYYQGRSQSFTSLADVSCVEDLAKKTTPYVRRSKASRSYAAALGVKNRVSKKKKALRGSHELLLSRGKKPPACQYQEGKTEVYRC